MRTTLQTFLYLSGALAVGGCGDSPRANSGDTGQEPPAAAPDAASRSAGGPAATANADAGRAPVPIEIEAVVGGRTKANARGVGECTHTDDASIYEVPATQWRAEYQGSGNPELEHLSLTLWQPKSGGEEFTLSLQVAGATHQIATVKRGTLAGSGTATVRRAGAAGTFVVEGKDGKGVPLRLTVKCDRFTEPVAEGG